MNEENREQKAQAPNNLMVSIAIVAIGVLVLGVVYFSSGDRTPSNALNPNPTQQVVQQQPGSNQGVDINNVKIDGLRFVGKKDAPVVMAYWGDFQCPFCKQLESSVVQQIVKDYPDKVKIVFKDFQFLGADSQTAGLAARAVWEVDPNKYFAWHLAIFEKQDSENSGWGNKDDIIALTKTILGDSKTNKVSSLMVSKQAEYQKGMDEDKVEAGTFGIDGTPGTIIGTNLISGAQPYSAFKQIIDLTLQGK